MFDSNTKYNKANRLKLRYWIGLGYCVPIALFIISAIIVTINVRSLNEKNEEFENKVQIADDMSEIEIHAQITSRSTRGYLLDPNPTSVKSFENAKNTIKTYIEKLKPLIKDEQQIATFQKILENLQKLEELNELLIKTVDQQGNQAGIKLWKQDAGRGVVEELSNLFDEFDERQEQLLTETNNEEDQALNSLFITVWFAVGVSVIIASIFGVWLVNWITRQLNETASSIATSTQEIAATIEQQDRTASQQAASVNETTTTVEELGASARQSTQQAEAATHAAREALQLAENGDSAVQQTLVEMDELKHKVEAIAEQIMRLSEQTNQIGNISELVSNIAKRTNMLALNAAVEAVRAGEHGKGFSVVAGEIRKLADQSKQSAAKINDLVTQIQNSINVTVMVTDEGTKTVDSGMRIVANTAQAFSGVKESVNNVVMNNQQISLNIKQQSTAFQQVLDAMNVINQGARETSSGIAQTRIGTQKLNDATTDLENLV